MVRAVTLALTVAVLYFGGRSPQGRTPPTPVLLADPLDGKTFETPDLPAPGLSPGAARRARWSLRFRGGRATLTRFGAATTVHYVYRADSVYDETAPRRGGGRGAFRQYGPGRITAYKDAARREPLNLLTEHDPHTGELRWDGARYRRAARPSRVQPAPDPLDGLSFTTPDLRDGGLGPDGMIPMRWSLRFNKGRVQGMQSDTGLDAFYVCDRGRVVVFDRRRRVLSVEASYDVGGGEVIWEGVTYRRGARGGRP